MSMDDMFKAMQMFDTGVKKLAVSSAINDAASQVDQLNQQQMGLLEKRQAQTQLGNSLAMRLAGLDADPTQIQSAVGAVAPPPVKDSTDLYNLGVAQGDEKAVSLASKMQSFENKPKLDLQNDQQSFLSAEKDKELASAEKIAGLKANKADANTIEKQFQELGKEAVNPSNRKTMGRYVQNIDNADAIITMANGLGLKPGEQPPANETPAQRIARYNSATDAQRYELATALDRLLKQSAPTDSGTEHLLPKTAQTKLQSLKQYLVNAPTGAKAGDFVQQTMDTVQRERGNFAKKSEALLGKYRDIYKPAYEADPKRFMNIIASPANAQVAAGMDPNLAKKIAIAKKYPNDPEAQAFLKSVGADQ